MTTAGTPRTPKLIAAIRRVIEVAEQGEEDWCGEQRAFHLPRIKEAMALLAELFTAEAIAAMSLAENAWGDKLVRGRG